MSGKAIEVLLVGGRDEGPQFGALLRIVEEHAPGDFRAAGSIGEGYREREIVPLLDVPHDNLLRHDDRGETVIHRVARAIGAAHREAPHATRPKVEFVQDVGETVWPPPRRQRDRIGVSSEDLRARLRKQSRGNDPVIAGSGVG